MTIKELYENVYSNIETKAPDVFIHLFEENKSVIESQSFDNDKDSHYAVMRLLSDYAHGLTVKEAYSKALPYLDKAIDLMENYDAIDKAKMNDFEFYRILRFDRGISNFYKKNYSKSQFDFEWLIKNNPDYDIYKNWISAILFRKYDSVINILSYLFAASIIFGAIVDKRTYFHYFILYSGVLAMICTLIFKIVKYKNKRKLGTS